MSNPSVRVAYMQAVAMWPKTQCERLEAECKEAKERALRMERQIPHAFDRER